MKGEDELNDIFFENVRNAAANQILLISRNEYQTMYIYAIMK